MEVGRGFFFFVVVVTAVLGVEGRDRAGMAPRRRMVSGLVGGGSIGAS